MNPEEQLLKEKVLLLLSRERELGGLRKKHTRVSAWLAVAQALPELVSLRSSDVVYPALSRTLIALLKLQDVAFFEVSASHELRHVGGRAREPASALSPEAAALLAGGAGICNDTENASHRALGEAVGLYRFMWYWIALGEGESLLVAAGCTKEKAPFYPVFEQEDFGHFRNMGQQLAVLLRNAALIGALDDEKRALEALNDTLERRVVERTDELARANRTLADALEALQHRERRLKDDLEQARLFQENTRPNQLVSRLVEFASAMRPLEIVGGDVYDVAEIAPDRFRVFVADVTGHGVQASMRTIVLKAEYERIKHDHRQPETLLAALNERLTRSFPRHELVCTAVCFDVVFADDVVSMRYVNAAHPPLLVVGQGAREIYRDGPFLGLSLDVELEGADVELAFGDWVFAYTDGFCDQIDASGSLFPVKAEVSAAVTGQDVAKDAVSRVLARLDEFRGETPMHDDLALVALRVRRPG